MLLQTRWLLSRRFSLDPSWYFCNRFLAFADSRRSHFPSSHPFRKSVRLASRTFIRERRSWSTIEILAGTKPREIQSGWPALSVMGWLPPSPDGIVSAKVVVSTRSDFPTVGRNGISFSKAPKIQCYAQRQMVGRPPMWSLYSQFPTFGTLGARYRIQKVKIFYEMKG